MLNKYLMTILALCATTIECVDNASKQSLESASHLDSSLVVWGSGAANRAAKEVTGYDESKVPAQSATGVITFDYSCPVSGRQLESFSMNVRWDTQNFFYTRGQNVDSLVPGQTTGVGSDEILGTADFAHRSDCKTHGPTRCIYLYQGQLAADVFDKDFEGQRVVGISLGIAMRDRGSRFKAPSVVESCGTGPRCGGYRNSVCTIRRVEVETA